MLGYGISDFFAKKTIDKIGSLKTLLYSQIIGAAFISLYLIRDSSLPSFSIPNIIYILLFGIFNAAGYLALYRAFEVGKISIVSPISSSFVILAAIVSFLFFGESFSTLKTISLGLVIVGIILTAIDLKDLRDGVDISDLSKGVPEAMVVFLVFGLYAPLWDRFIEGPGWVVWAILVKIILSFTLISYATLVRKQSLSFKQSSLIYWLVFIALFEAMASFGNSWAFNASINTTSIIVAITSTYPLVTALLAFTLLKERLALNQYIGIGIIISGLVMMPFI